MKIAGLDIGTTGCKLTVFDESGERLGKAYREYAVHRDFSGHEIDVTAVMDSVYAVIREMTEQHKDIAGIGVTSFGETFVMTDDADRRYIPPCSIRIHGELKSAQNLLRCSGKNILYGSPA